MSDESMGVGIAPAPKRTMSEEHKAKMRAGRERARTRGRPAAREAVAPLPREAAPSVSGEPTVEELERRIAAVGDGASLTRQPRGTSDATFDIPMQGRLKGWDYEFKTVRVFGEEVDASELTEIDAAGWIPVPASHFPSLVPPGWRRPYIERRGMRAYMRPDRLSQEARKELAQHAYQQKQDRLRAQQAGDVGREMARRVNPDGSPAASIDVDIRPLL